MDNNLNKPSWQRLGILLLLISLGCLTMIVLTKSGFASAKQAVAVSPGDIIQIQPVLTPTVTTVCDSKWYTLSFDASGVQTAYLTRSVTDPTKSTNQGVWRPNLAQDGIYSVSAFVPAHNTILWCNGQTISRDTYSANYTIHYNGGQKNVIVNQFPLNDEWYPLGMYPFSEGTSGYVHLSDLTIDTITRTVSFSDMRFTYVRPIPTHIQYMPVLYQNYPAISLTQTWTADNTGSPRTIFLPNEPMRYYASGTNSNNAPIDANLEMSIAGSCYTGTIYDGAQSIATGNWSVYKSANAPACLGVFTLTVNVTQHGNTVMMSSPFIVSASTVALKNIPAFDKCTVPTTSQMKTWWDHSPYQTINIYMGGIMYPEGCNNINLNAFWVQAVSQQGWTFIPTWVGPQAPCTTYEHRMSANASVAYTQGRNEADKAFNAAVALGFDAQSVLYYDLEGYATSNASACRNAVKSFLNGWVERLHERGARAGVYGGDCSSYANDWYTLAHIPDDVWIANWNTKFSFDPYASVYDLTCLVDDNKWAGHRIRQYTGEFNSTWGGLSMTIDADVVDGEVTAIPLTQLAVPPSNLAEGSASPTSPASAALPSGQKNIYAFQPVSDEAGWALLESKLLWHSGSGLWKDITPAYEAASQIVTAFFLDERLGWLVMKDLADDRLTLYSTHDTGGTWEKSAIASPDGQPIATISLEFLNAQTGWLAVKLSSGNSFSHGSLYNTNDGGKSWTVQPLPIAGSVRFIDAKRGWIAGGPGGNELYITRDGGVTWQSQQPDPGQEKSGQTFISLPYFTSEREGWLVVTVSDALNPHVDLFITNDAGENWQKHEVISLEAAYDPADAIPSNLVDEDHWLLAGNGKPRLYTLQPASRSDQGQSSALPVNGLPGGVVQISHASQSTSWALTREGNCSGSKLKPGEVSLPEAKPYICSSSDSLWQSSDGGANWTNITPPSEMP
jgi:photosystem II stability/assembly factor-like uncharacterized protein